MRKNYTPLFLCFLVLKKDEEYSSSEDEQPTYVPTFDQKEFEEPKRNDDDDKDEHKEPEEQWPNQENEENSKDDEDTDDKDKYGKETDDDYEGFAFLQDDLMCSLQNKPGIPASWILLDSQ